jgi:hypothetical protein
MATLAAVPRLSLWQRVDISRKIVQYLPAPGWYATYSESSKVPRVPLACWGVTEDGEIMGIVFWYGYFGSAEAIQSGFLTSSSFTGYELS